MYHIFHAFYLKYKFLSRFPVQRVGYLLVHEDTAGVVLAIQPFNYHANLAISMIDLALIATAIFVVNSLKCMRV